ncbi:unnamed protein product [Cylindrotheca closterium]|uniref:AMP deaminase n=1 Tax=Cylindrotheca closterium TaxID=2856 RepID=A0AAD2FUH7_9STRA|nr:unnamed protein product [Cylindrotheca closterium]
MSDSLLFAQGGPPDPIAYLRRISGDSGDELSGGDDEGVKNEAVKPTRVQEPPARERPAQGQAWPYRDTLSFTRSLIFYGSGAVTHEHERACKDIQECRQMRQKYCGQVGTFRNMAALKKPDITFRFGREGVVELYSGTDSDTNLSTVPTVKEFRDDYHRLVEMVNSGAMRSFCFQRLQLLSSAFKTHITMNGPQEAKEQSTLLGTDFYRTLKIDNHIHAAAAPSAKQFVNFVTGKLEKEGDTVVTSDGKTLKEIFENAGIDRDHLTIDAFNVLADYSVYQRFDNFNAKYSPFRMADLRRIFLKTNNAMGGRYFAELMKLVLDRHEQSKGHTSACEMRLSIYGMERNEWKDLATWMTTDWGGDFPGPVISTHNRWLIQIPRLWRIFRLKPGNEQTSFQAMLENIFAPMFEATLHPEEHPEIAEALKHIVGFDSVDDEGLIEDPCACQRPHEWKGTNTPAYWWQLYFLWANLEVLNSLREARGLNTFAFRPHAGETGDPMHLASTYMLCESINHGVNLGLQVSLQYLYYLDQIGLSISPLSNNFLFRKIANNPFPKFFRRGLNVTLSTDDPLLFHMSDDALLEEYSVARATFDLSMTDMMEIARNSIMQSGFKEEFKEKYLGKNFRKGATFCDEHSTHVPLIRAKFRAEHLAIEHMLCTLIAAGKGNAVLEEMKIQFGLARDAHRDVLFESLDEVPEFPERNQL